MDDAGSARGREFRVEHRVGDETRMLGDLDGVVPHVSLLDPWASRLRHAGGTGELRLIHRETGELVARHDLDAPPRWRGGTRTRELNRALTTLEARSDVRGATRPLRSGGDD